MVDTTGNGAPSREYVGLVLVERTDGASAGGLFSAISSTIDSSRGPVLTGKMSCTEVLWILWLSVDQAESCHTTAVCTALRASA